MSHCTSLSGRPLPVLPAHDVMNLNYLHSYTVLMDHKWSLLYLNLRGGTFWATILNPGYSKSGSQMFLYYSSSVTYFWVSNLWNLAVGSKNHTCRMTIVIGKLYIIQLLLRAPERPFSKHSPKLCEFLKPKQPRTLLSLVGVNKIWYLLGI